MFSTKRSRWLEWLVGILAFGCLKQSWTHWTAAVEPSPAARLMLAAAWLVVALLAFLYSRAEPRDEGSWATITATLALAAPYMGFRRPRHSRERGLQGTSAIWAYGLSPCACSRQVTLSCGERPE